MEYGLKSSFVLTNYIFKDPILKYDHILRCWRLGFQYMNLGRVMQFNLQSMYGTIVMKHIV